MIRVEGFSNPKKSGLRHIFSFMRLSVDVQPFVFTDKLQEQLAQGNENPGIGRKHICRGVFEHPGNNGGRLYTREVDSVVEILAKSGKKKSN